LADVGVDVDRGIKSEHIRDDVLLYCRLHDSRLRLYRHGINHQRSCHHYIDSQGVRTDSFCFGFLCSSSIGVLVVLGDPVFGGAKPDRFSCKQNLLRDATPVLTAHSIFFFLEHGPVQLAPYDSTPTFSMRAEFSWLRWLSFLGPSLRAVTTNWWGNHQLADLCVTHVRMHVGRAFIPAAFTRKQDLCSPPHPLKVCLSVHQLRKV
jgi:hypothetical protein